MTKVRMGTGVKSIEAYTFSGCSKLEDMQIGSNVATINTYAFSGCKTVPVIKIPHSVTDIKDYVFYQCSGLKTVSIEERETVLNLGHNGSSPLFSSCPLDSVYIGGNINYSTSSSYGYSPFYRNTTLRSVVITDKETEISENEFYGCTNLKNVSIGDGVESIGNWAFSGCSSLDYFAFGTALKTIGKEAFSDCTAVTRISSRAATPPTCGSQALDDINKWTCTLSVPSGGVNVYQAANQWKEFFFIQDDAPASNAITGIVHWDGRKNENYWYMRNSHVERSGFDETHAVVYAPEDEVEQQTSKLWEVITNTFKKNKIVDLNSDTDMNSFITLTNKNGVGTPSISGKDLTLSLQFTTGTFNTFKGYYGNPEAENIITYVANKRNGGDGRALMAWVDYNKNSVMDSNEPCDTITTLEFTNMNAQDINHMRVVYHKNNIAKALLNWRSHNDLQDDVLTAYVTVKAKYDDSDIDLTCTPISIRFLRPVNAIPTSTEIEETNYYGSPELHVFNLRDLICFTDWRDEPFKSSYWYYYDIQKIEIEGADNNIYDAIQTNFHQNSTSTFVKLSSFYSLLDLQYNPRTFNTSYFNAPNADSYGVLTYRKLSNTTADYDLKFKVRVTYYWGSVLSGDVILHVSGDAATTAITLENDMQTYCSLDDMDFSGTDDIKAYIVSAFKPSTGEVTLTRITDVPANTGIVVKGAAGTYSIPMGLGETIVSNMLRGVTTNTVLNKVEGDNTNYVLAKKNGNLGFYAVVDGSTLSAGKAYLPLPTASLPSGARSIKLVFEDGGTTGISEASPLNDNGELINDNVYDLQGRRVEKPTRGLYVVNGRKVVIK